MEIEITRCCHIDAKPREIGERIAVDADLGARLCEAGYARPHIEQRIETAALDTAGIEQRDDVETEPNIALAPEIKPRRVKRNR